MSGKEGGYEGTAIKMISINLLRANILITKPKRRERYLNLRDPKRFEILSSLDSILYGADII